MLTSETFASVKCQADHTVIVGFDQERGMDCAVILISIRASMEGLNVETWAFGRRRRRPLAGSLSAIRRDQWTPATAATIVSTAATPVTSCTLFNSALHPKAPEISEIWEQPKGH